MRHKILVSTLVLSLSACAQFEALFSETPPPSDFPDVKAAPVEPVHAGEKAPRGDGLPDTDIPAANLHGVPVTAALQAVLYGTDVPLSWDAKTLKPHPVTLVNLKGDLPTVVDKICAAATVSCVYRSGVLEVAEKKASPAPHVLPSAPALPPVAQPPAPPPQVLAPPPPPPAPPPQVLAPPPPPPAPPEPVAEPKPQPPPQVPIVAPPSPVKTFERPSDELPPPILIDKDGARPVAPQRKPDRMSSLDTRVLSLGTISRDDLATEGFRRGGRP